MITDNYIKIKMCEQAEEIQEVWRNPFRNKFGDLYWRGNKYLMIPEACILNTDSHFIPEEEVWLPTQEQLQEMVLPIFLKRYSTTHALRNDSSFIYRMIIEKFQRWINRSSPSFDEYMAMFNSMNELWLAFVMHEKYNKIWTGEKWVKADD